MSMSFCIKTNNKTILKYIIENFKNSTPKNFYLSKNKFKIYNNVIFHYIGEDITTFYSYISSIIQYVILNFYEEKILYNFINFEYFYFSDFEKKEILNIAKHILEENENLYNTRKNILYHLCYSYVKNNKTMVLDGFVNFRIREYSIILSEIVSDATSEFTIQKEYDEFVELLKTYIDTSSSKSKLVHLIYFNDDSLLLDENKNIISIDKNISTAKYLSDITFSSNDYCLNTLLNLIPKKIIIHLLNTDGNNEFIDTLCAIFGKRVFICLDCNICNLYKTNDSFKSTT